MLVEMEVEEGVHLLLDLRLFLEEEVDVDVDVTRGDTPREAADYLIELGEGRNTSPEVTGSEQHVDDLLVLLSLQLIHLHFAAPLAMIRHRSHLLSLPCFDNSNAPSLPFLF